MFEQFKRKVDLEIVKGGQSAAATAPTAQSVSEKPRIGHICPFCQKRWESDRLSTYRPCRECRQHWLDFVGCALDSDDESIRALVVRMLRDDCPLSKEVRERVIAT